MILFSYVLHYIIFAVFLYFSFFIIICLLMYTLAIVGVYACLASRGRVTGDRHAFISRCQRSTEKPLPISRFLLYKALHPLPATPDPLLRKGSIKKEQPPHSSCSLIPKGFHYIYFIPYI